MKNWLLIKRIDITVQLLTAVVCLFLCIGTAKFTSLLNVYYAVGIVQVASAAMHRLFINTHPKKTGRTVYEFCLLGIALISIIPLILHLTNTMKFLVIYYGYAMLFLGVAMAIFYLLITISDIFSLLRER